MTDKKVIDGCPVSADALRVALRWFPDKTASQLDCGVYQEITDAIDRGPIQIVIPGEKT